MAMGLVIALKGLLDSMLWHSSARRIVELELVSRRSTCLGANLVSVSAADAADGVGGLSIGSALKASAPAFVPGRRPH